MLQGSSTMTVLERTTMHPEGKVYYGTKIFLLRSVLWSERCERTRCSHSAGKQVAPTLVKAGEVRAKEWDL